MALTEKQDIPQRPVASEPWSRKILLNIQSTAQTLARVFTALEVVLLFMVTISGVGELFGRHLSWGWYVLTGLVLCADVWFRDKVERYPTETKKK